MTLNLPATCTAAILMGLLLVVMTAGIGLMRRHSQISIGDGGDKLLARRMRGHANAAMVTRLGAVRTIDYHAADYANGRARYDVVFDVVGKSRFGRARKVLKPGGLYMSPVLSMGLLAAMLTTRWTGRRKATFSATGLLPADVLRKMLATVRDMATEGRLTTVIDRSYPLARIHDAYRYVDQGHKRGNVLVTPA